MSLYFLVIGGISLVFFLLHNLLEVLSGNLTFAQVFTLPLNHWHLVGVLLSAALAGSLRVGAPSATQLAWIDGAGCVAVLGCDDMMAYTLLGVPAPRFDLVITLAYVLFKLSA